MLKKTKALFLKSILFFGIIVLLPGSRFIKAQFLRDSILTVTDDHRRDALGAYGNSVIQTLELHQMAKEGALFKNTFVTTSICASILASIMTCQYPSRHEVRGFQSALNMEQLKEEGYFVGFLGRCGVGKPPDHFFDYDKTFSGQGYYFHKTYGKTTYLAGSMGDQVLKFLDRSVSVDSPFLLSISFKAAHVQDSYKVNDRFIHLIWSCKIYIKMRTYRCRKMQS